MKTIWDLDDQIFTKHVSESKTWTELLMKCGYKSAGNPKTVKKRIEKMKLDYSHLPIGHYSKPGPVHKYTSDEIFKDDSKYRNNSDISKKLIKEFNWERKC